MKGILIMTVGTQGSLKKVVKIDNIENRILLIRGQRVIIDADLAELYNVKTQTFK